MMTKFFKYISYGTLGLPISFLGMPLYVFLPKYLSTIGMSLVAISSLILITRLFDAVQDPILGVLFNKVKTLKARSWFVVAGLLALLPIVWFLFSSALHSYVSLLLILVGLYTVYSITMINYYAIAAEIPSSSGDKTTITSCREGFFLVGVLVFSSVPVFIDIPLENNLFYQKIAGIYAYVVLATLVTYLYFHFKSPVVQYKPNTTSWTYFLKNKLFLKLVVLYFVSTLASSIPGALFIFYVKDLLTGTDQQVGQFLLVYFISAVFGLPLWVHISKKYSKRLCWIVATALAVASFVWAFGLGPGDFIPFFIICFASGLALGADLAIPPSILADQISQAHMSTTSYFGIWAFVSKTAMALGAATALYTLDIFGYEDGGRITESSLFGLSFTYALLPCILKLCFLGMLLINKNIGKRYA